MANWDEIRTNVSRAAKKTVNTTQEIASNASMHAKLARLVSKRDEQFARLGQLTYKQLKTDVSYAEEISAVISQIDTYSRQIASQKAKIEKAKAEKVQAKAQKKEEKEARAEEKAKREQEELENCAEKVQEIIDENKDA